MIVIIGAIAELERNLIVERVRAGMRRARLEGRRIGRPPLDVDREALIPRPPPRPQPGCAGQDLPYLAGLGGAGTTTV